jgi:hypothetical protein
VFALVADLAQPLEGLEDRPDVAGVVGEPPGNDVVRVDAAVAARITAEAVPQTTVGRVLPGSLLANAEPFRYLPSREPIAAGVEQDRQNALAQLFAVDDGYALHPAVFAHAGSITILRRRYMRARAHWPGRAMSSFATSAALSAFTRSAS